MKRVIAAGFFLIAGACGRQDAALPTAKPLSPDVGRYVAPSYSPDGSRIAYWMPASEGAAGWQLWIAKADLSGAEKVAATVAPLMFPSPAEWSPDGRQVAVGSSDFGMLNVSLVSVDGGPAQRLTKSTGVEVPVAWDRDGDHLYYLATSGASISGFKVSTKTGEVTAAVPGEKRPYLAVLSPDGTRVAYAVLEGAKSTLWVADTTGANARQLTTEGFENIQLGRVWSPDSKEIVYESIRTGTTDIWVAPVDGTKPRQLTHDVRNDYGAAWSPDGKAIAFISDRGRQTDVWVVPAAGGVEQRVTDTAVEEETPLEWRPRSNEILFATRLGHGGVWAVDAAAGGERQLTPDSVHVRWFNVSPNGGEFNYVAERGSGAADLVVAPMAGGPSRTLVTGTGSVDAPRWSWDGTKIVFSSDRGGSTDVWVVDASGGAARALVKWPGFENGAVWNHDGSAVLFSSDRDATLSDVWSVAIAGGEPKRLTTAGSASGPGTQRGVMDVLVRVVTAKDGRFGISRLGVDGALHTVWDKSNAVPSQISPRGDSIVAIVEQPNGKQASMLLSMKTGAGRTILKDGDIATAFSPDAKFLSYSTKAGGGRNLALLNLADGSSRVLTKGSDDVAGTEFTPDGKTLVFRRTKIVQRLVTVDVTKLLQGGK